MADPVIVEAVRTPFGKRGGRLAGLRPQAVLAHALNAVVDRAGIDPAEVEQVFAGCVTQGGRAGRPCRPVRLAVRGAAPAGRGDHARRAVRFQPAGRPSGRR